MEKELGIAVMTQFGLLGEWWCVDPAAGEEACLDVIAAHAPIPKVDRELVRDRLYGGFRCEDLPHRRHVYLESGAYTYVNPERNRPRTPDERRETWATLIKANGEPGNGPFTGK